MNKLLSLFGCFLMLTACVPKAGFNEAHFNGYAQGTTFHLSFLHEGPEPHNIGKRIDSLFRAVDQALSTYVPQSDISKLNRGETLSPNTIFQKVHRKSIEVFEASEGYFDPTVGKLVRFWGFGPDARRQVDTNLVDSLKNYVGLLKLKPIGPNWSLPRGMELDYNAIAQGYTVDLLCELLMTLEVSNYMVEVGGEVRCLGANLKGDPWRIGVDKPTEEINEQDRFQFILGMDSLSLATSGNYRKFWVDTLNGMRYAHTINTKSGYPAKNRLLSASVLMSSCMEADGYATAFMSMGLQRTLAYYEKHKAELDLYLIYSEEGKEGWQVFQSEGFKKRILNQ
jgi:thiamine biosynthesis lipoprotein